MRVLPILRGALPYKVFVSHGWHDRWIAKQIAENIRRESVAETFIDIFDIKSGDRIEEKVREGLTVCDELISLLTPWSVERNWVWAEMAAAWIQRKRYVGIMYGMTLDDIDKKYGGLAILSPTNVINLNEVDGYFAELATRGRNARDA